MGDPYDRESTYDTRKTYYTPSEYAASARQGQSDYYDGRNRGSDTQYRRSFDTGADRSLDGTTDISRRRSVARYDDRYDDRYGSDRYSDRYTDRDSDRDFDRRRRRDRDYDSTERGSLSEYGEPDGNIKEKLKSRFNGDEQKLDGIVGTDKKDLAATLAGAVAGGFLGYQGTHGRRFGALGGALLGGFAGNALEHQQLKRRNDREKRERRYDSD